MKESVIRINQPVRDGYEAHKIAWKLMKDTDNVNGQRDFQFRFAPIRERGETVFHFRFPFSMGNPGYPVVTRHSVGAKLGFSVRTMPCKKCNGVDASGKQWSSRRSTASKEETLAWFARIGLLNGFTLEQVDAQRAENLYCGKGPGFLREQWDFIGVLVVTDAAKFHTAMQRGIGRYRTFGQGMLVLLNTTANSIEVAHA